ncbi:MAG: hypothetical protein RIR26_2382 [Pseudomonadota bacterium]|jgi:hypothetical protein
MKIVRPLLVSCALALASAGTFSNVALAMGHGPALSIQHFNSKTTPVWIKLAAAGSPAGENVPLIGRFELGQGRSLQVLTKRPLQNSGDVVIELPWPAGKSLAFVEGEAPVQGHLVAGLANRGLYLMNAEETTRIQSDALNFVWPVSMEDASLASESTLERPNQPTPPSWQPRAVTKAEAVQPDLNRMLQTLETLTGDRSFMMDGKEVRIAERGGEENRKLTQKFVIQTLSDLGIEAKLIPYTYSGYKGANVEGTLWGADRSRFVIISGHMDSVRNKGADDDGSGVVSLLEAAHLFSKLRTLPVSIRFVGFDQEELGLIGSRAYANQLSKEETILGAVQADMIGYDSDNDFAYHTMDCDRPDSRPITKVVEEINGNLNLGLKKVAACTNRSDHASFWNKNIPATIISENFFGNDANSCYHRPCDLMNLINKEYMLRLTTLQVNTALSLALSAN